MTAYEMGIRLEVYEEESKQKQDDLITQAYLGAYWQRVKEMPKLKDLLHGQVEKKKQSPQDMLNMVKALNEAFNGSTY